MLKLWVECFPHRRRRHRRCAKFDCCNSRNLIIYIIRILLIELSYASPNTTRINLEKKENYITYFLRFQ